MNARVETETSTPARLAPCRDAPCCAATAAYIADTLSVTVRMPKLKSARHHWWPECVSQHWADERGFVHWLKPNGEDKRIPPAQLGMIGNGHMIKLGRAGTESPWDQSFEPAFDRADTAFPRVISWLNEMAGKARHIEGPVRTRFEPQQASDEELALLSECIISLAVRSPMSRAGAIFVAERLRGKIPAHERNAIIGLNMRETQRRATEELGAHGKFVVLHSPDREFIFGDGFYHNVRSPLNGMFMPEIVAPVTPRIAVAIYRPMAYGVDPKFMTIVNSAAETDGLNEAAQVYSRECIFYRSEKPNLIEAFQKATHLQYSAGSTASELLRSIPGVRRNPWGPAPPDLADMF